MKAWQKIMEAFREAKSSSDRTFGVVFAGIAFFLAGRQWHHEHAWGIFWPTVGASFFLLALIAPRTLHPINRAWTFAGIFLGFFVSPLVISVFYWGIFSPFAMVTRMFRGDVLGLRVDPEVKSYWIDYEGAKKNPERFRMQF